MESHHIAFFRYFIAVPVLLAVILAMGACAQLSVPAKHEVESVLLIAKLNKNTSFDSWMRRYA